jgi:hypothetical protein
MKPADTLFFQRRALRSRHEAIRLPRWSAQAWDHRGSALLEDPAWTAQNFDFQDRKSAGRFAGIAVPARPSPRCIVQ